jgi:CO/xanthine dehydrogenase Mo-binding subunit
VVAGQDLPDLAAGAQPMGEQTINPRYLSMNILARDKALYHGHAIAAVAATNCHIAEEALGLIKVEYEVLLPVLDVRDAMQDHAPILHQDLRTSGTPEKKDMPTNVANHLRFARGDLELGFRMADVVVEREFNTSMVHQGYIEPHNAVAQYNTDGNATLWVSTQGAFAVRDLCGHLLQMDASNINVVPAEIGGGFSGKTTVYLEPLALLLSKKVGKPVKMTMNRSEVLRATGPTSGSYIRCKIGATKEGKITAAQVWMAYEAGAFPGSPVGAGCMTILTPYDLENLQIDGFDVVLNKPKTCAYRAPGATNAALALETAIDELAEKLGIDPLEFRRLNGAKEGTAQPAGPKFPRIGFLETLEAANK